MTELTFAPKREFRIHQFFEVSVMLKGANAVVETILGAVLLVTPQFNDIVRAFVQNELFEDPGDFLARHMAPYTNYLSADVQLYAALYLLSHGIVKIVLVWGLLRNKMWAYPASLAVLGLFILYQAIKIVQNHSIFLIALTIFDLVVLWLIWHEYRYVSKKLSHQS